MDIKEIINNIKNKTKSLFDKIIEFYEENKLISLIIIIIFVLIILLIMLLSFSISNAKAKKKNVVVKEELSLSEEVFLPGKTFHSDEYILSRTANEKWTEKEAEEWFFIPGDKEVESLSKTNETLINEILKATP